MNQVDFILIGLVVVALAFDFLNGLHDAANSIATIVSTRVLSARWAVVWAAGFNFIAFLFFGLHVAQTVGKGIVDAAIVNEAVIFGALVGAIAWNVITWLGGIPSSSSHALIGGLVGAGVARAGFKAVVWKGLSQTALGIVVSPAMGFALALVLVVIVSWLFVKARPVFADRVFRRLQFVSASLYSLGHGGNDAQKTMGVIAVLLYARHQISGAFHVPLWVVLSCQTAMALGTLFGGWRIVHTMGSKLTRLTPQRVAPSPYSWPHPSACLYPPPTPSPAPLSGWAHLAGCRRCDGMSRQTSSGPGLSPCPPPPSWGRSPTTPPRSLVRSSFKAAVFEAH